MAMELILNFPDPAHVVVELIGEGRPRRTAPLPFAGPLTEADQDDLHWYLELYPTQYGTELDDDRAAAIAAKLEDWGQALFNAVFHHSYDAGKLYAEFAAQAEPGRLLSIDSGHPAVLAQPWELLRHPECTWLFLANPRISVCRRLSGQAAPFSVAPKDRLRLLFVVSRPDGQGFIDPRSDPRAVMAALETQAPGRVTVEFLRPPTLGNLIDRLEDEDRPPVDILHFDGHGVYDEDGRLAARAAAGLKGLAAARDWDKGGAGGAAHQGYLLFEDADGGEQLVSAALLGEMLNQQRIPLTVLSACQSAKVGGDDPLGSVAAQLTRAGFPTVLAMTHSVLADTTRALFGYLYRELGRGRSLGAALENARRELYLHRGRGERRRGDGWITLLLQDWFLPALYQVGQDTPLLTKTTAAPVPEPTARHNLPEVQPSGFWGRARELWEIEHAFVAGTRRLVIHGFGGQGKTYLAQETGRWLLATGMFERVCLVSFAGFQGVDPVGYAVSTLALVLGESLLDEAAAGAALARTPTLLILDNLESLGEDPDMGARASGPPRGQDARAPGGRDARAPLDALLTAALPWSTAGASRCLCTTRTPDLEHPGFPTEGDRRCRYLKLRGLAPWDAFDWYQAILRQTTHARPRSGQWQPPGRDDLLALFAKVQNHPLSIGLLTEALKDGELEVVAARLDELLAVGDGPLVASLNLSLERLDPEARALLPRLGVFQGGAFERDLLAVTEITAGQWTEFRPALLLRD